jgi:hypothetical protein
LYLEYWTELCTGRLRNNHEKGRLFNNNSEEESNPSSTKQSSEKHFNFNIVYTRELYQFYGGMGWYWEENGKVEKPSPPTVTSTFFSTKLNAFPLIFRTVPPA